MARAAGAVTGRPRAACRAEGRPQHDEREAERLLAAALKQLGLSLPAVAALKKTDARKQALAWLIKSRTVVGDPCIAGRLEMGHHTPSRPIPEPPSDGPVAAKLEKKYLAIMKIEHFALNVKNPIAMSNWYCEHLGMQVKRKLDTAPHTHFLADSSGQVMLEIYCNPPDAVPDYPSIHPLQLHLAFVSGDPSLDRSRLVRAGATVVEEQHLPDGSHLLTLRDPWGFAIQFCKRGTPMI